MVSLDRRSSLAVASLALASFASLASFTLTACSSVELAAPIIRERVGPAAQRPVRRVVALPASCGALTLVPIPDPAGGPSRWEQRVACSAQALTAVEQAVRARLELGGFTIIDSERVNAVTASRREIIERRQYSATSTIQNQAQAQTLPQAQTQTETQTETTGARFDDATPLEQREMLAELGAQGVLTTRVTIGAQTGFSGRRVATVQIQLLDVPDRELVLARRCELEVGGLLMSDEVAMERAASCAAEGILSR